MPRGHKVASIFADKPPLILIIPRTALGGVYSGGSFDPLARDDLFAVPIAEVQIEPSKLGEVSSARGDAAESLIQSFTIVINTPQAVIFHSQRFPNFSLHDRIISHQAAFLSRENFPVTITALGALLQGGLGKVRSGNIHPGQVSLFEPVHGSSPYMAGQNKANPIAAILTVAMMMDFLGKREAAAAIENAVQQAVDESQVTADIGGKLGTRECGDYVVEVLATYK